MSVTAGALMAREASELWVISTSWSGCQSAFPQGGTHQKNKFFSESEHRSHFSSTDTF